MSIDEQPDGDPHGECAFEIARLEKELAAMTAERDRLRNFADRMLVNWPTGDVDGGELQDAAVECGLLIATHPTEPCNEGDCSCLEYFGLEEFAEGGVTCYRREKS